MMLMPEKRLEKETLSIKSLNKVKRALAAI